MKESESKDDSIQVECNGSTHGNFLSCGEPDGHMTRQAMSDRQLDVRWLQVCAWHHRSYIAEILLLARGLTVKLSPCQCSHSSPAGRIAACLCGHPKCNLLLAQAHPRMIQHLSSNSQWFFTPIIVKHTCMTALQGA